MVENNFLKNKAFWALNGNLEKREIESQVELFKRYGFGGFFLHARAGLTLEYMSEKWLSALEYAIEKAKEVGLDVYLYDEYGWPSGFGGGVVNGLGEDYCQKYLSCDGDKSNTENVVQAFKIIDGKYISTDDVSNADIIYRYTVNPYYIDIFNSAVIDEFIKSTHEVYYKRFSKHFGNTVKGIFTDEPQYNGHNIYSKYLFSEFESIKGYKVEDKLYLFDKESQEADKFRKDYFDVVCELYEKNFVQKINSWCREHNILFTGHFPEEDGISTQYLKGGDIMFNYINMDYPGIDTLGRRLCSPVLYKQISSVKEQLEKKYVISESFGCCGWNTYLKDYMWIYGYENVLGINSACIHLSAYSITGVRKRDYPAFFSYQSSWNNDIKVLSDWMYNLNRFSSTGKYSTDILLLSPVTSCYSQKAHGTTVQIQSTEFRNTVESLCDIGLQFDIADENYFNKLAKFKEKLVSIGCQNYGIIILPYVEIFDDNYAELLELLIKNNIKFVFTTSLPMVDCSTKQKLKYYKETLSKDNVVQNRRELWLKFFNSIHYERKIEITSVKDGYTPKDVYVRYTTENNKIYFTVFNKSVTDEKQLVIKVNEIGDICNYELQTDSYQQLKCYCNKNNTYTEIDLKPMETLAFIFEKEKINKTDEEKVLSMNLLVPNKINCDENTINIDRASISIDGGDYCEEEYVIRLQEKVHQLAQVIDKKSKINVKYTFESNVKFDKINLYFEPNTVDGCTVNGIKVNADKENWFIDKEIYGCNVADNVQIGKNEIILTYTLEPLNKTFKYDEIFESEKNRFSYNIDIESVYLKGKFDVVANGQIEKYPDYYKIQNRGYVLKAETLLSNTENITQNNKWFYRGNVYAHYNIDYRDGKKFIKITNAKCALIKVLINNRNVVNILNDREVEITKFLEIGENEITVIAVGTNRNLLGPHHHYKGEQRFVGVNTFRGVNGYEDSITDVDTPESTYVEDYAFVDFGYESAYLITKK